MEYNSNNQTNLYQRQNFLADSQTIPKSLEELNLMDSFLLAATTEDPENAKTIAKVAIKRATGHDIKNLIVETQKQFKGISLTNAEFDWTFMLGKMTKMKKEVPHFDSMTSNQTNITKRTFPIEAVSINL